MEATSMSFQSSRKIIRSAHRPISSPISSVPDEILIQVFSIVAGTCTRDLFNLKRVSKLFNRLCSDDYVLQLHTFPEPTIGPYRSIDLHFYNKYMKSLSLAGNMYALLNVGLCNMFGYRADEYNAVEYRMSIGLEQLVESAGRGSDVARYIAAVVLYCRGGEAQLKAMDLLTPLVDQWMESTWNRLENLRMDSRRRISRFWGSGVVMRVELQKKFARQREKCSCSGKGSEWFYHHRWYMGFDEFVDIETHTVCSTLVLACSGNLCISFSPVTGETFYDSSGKCFSSNNLFV